MTAEEEDTDLDVFDKAAPEQVAPKEKEWTDLPHADLLGIEDADELMRWRPANLVAIVGERDAGKTTLVAEIYERFLRAPFAGLMFAGSRTLTGFEKRCYLARIRSGAAAPDTVRTSVQQGLRFFHLGLTSVTDRRRHDLLISERAGESYRAARDDPPKARGYLELSKARTIVFALDGERVVNDKIREDATSTVRNLIRIAAESGSVSPLAEVQLVTTKLDFLLPETAAHALAAVEDFERRMLDENGNRFAKFTVWRTAARGPSSLVEAAFGVAPLLLSWLSPPTPAPPVPAQPILQDEFDRLLLRARRR